METCGQQQLDWMKFCPAYSPKSSVEAIGISADGKQVAAAESATITLFELQQAPDAIR